MDYEPIKPLIGVTLKSAEKVNDEKLVFTTEDGREFIFDHLQNCCEHVRIEDIVGDLNDLVGVPIVKAEVITSGTWPIDKPKPEYLDSFTWTYYKFATIKGYVSVRWYGESNGYYSESVDIREKRGEDYFDMNGSESYFY